MNIPTEIKEAILAAIKDPKTGKDLTNMLESIVENDYIDTFHNIPAMVRAKRDGKLGLRKVLEELLPLAKAEEKRREEVENKKGYEEYQKILEERKLKDVVNMANQINQEIKRMKKARESPVKKIWDLYFITHIDNLHHVTKDGIVAPILRPTDYKKIANTKISDYRNGEIVINNMSAMQYAHVYFRPRNAMLAAILMPKRCRLDEIIIIRINIDLTEHELYITDRNAVKVRNDNFIPSNRYMEIIPKIEPMLKESSWYDSPDPDLKTKMMAECHILHKFPLNSMKAICIADKRSIEKRGYNFAEFYDNVKSKISRESVLTANNIEQRGELFFNGLYG